MSDGVDVVRMQAWQMIANRLRDWSWIDIGLGMNGLLIENRLEMDLC